MDASRVLFVVIAGVLIVAILIFGPLLFIWSLNTLFGLGIAYTFKTWLASLLVSGVVGGTSGLRRKGG